MVIFNNFLYVYQMVNPLDQWEFQDPKMEVLYHMGASQKSGMDRSAVIRTMDRECLRKAPDPYPFVRAHHSIQTVLILLLSPTCYYFSSCYCYC